MTALFFGSILPWMLVGVGGLLCRQLVRQNGRILLRLDAIEQRLSRPSAAPSRPPAQGLTIGTPAPDFELPDLAGRQHRLVDWRGHELLLLFFNPKCGFCTKMAADLAALPTDGENGRPVPIIVTTGNIEANRKLVKQHGLKCLVLQQQMEVATQYRCQGTPMGYRIDVAGRIASEVTVGAEPLLQLASGTVAQRPARTSAWEHSPHTPREPDPSLARSRLNRKGLKAGQPAPEFSLPRIGGGELSLAELHGQRVLLVFSDPDCGPCDQLASHLQELHEQRSDLQVVVISRRDADATRAKAEQRGLTYPIVMQKQWELSLKYGMFATPIGYLIDERGVLLSDVAVGVEPILEMTTLSQLNGAADVVGVHSSEEHAVAAS